MKESIELRVRGFRWLCWVGKQGFEFDRSLKDVKTLGNILWACLGLKGWQSKRKGVFLGEKMGEKNVIDSAGWRL